MRLMILLMFLALGPGAWAESEVDLKIIRMIESSGCKNTVGDSWKALGCYQLHEGVIRDYNREHRTAYTHQIAQDKATAHAIAFWYINREIPRLLRHYGLADTLEARLTGYNMGVGAVRKGRIAVEYVKKYRKQGGIHYGKQSEY